jgi:hypothetical protein
MPIPIMFHLFHLLMSEMLRYYCDVNISCSVPLCLSDNRNISGHIVFLFMMLTAVNKVRKQIHCLCIEVFNTNKAKQQNLLASRANFQNFDEAGRHLFLFCCNNQHWFKCSVSLYWKQPCINALLTMIAINKLTDQTRKNSGKGHIPPPPM